MIGRGLGEYPGYYCYDANRPSWLPYWIDDITESLCKWNPKTIAGNVTACATGDPSCPPVLSTPWNPNPTGAVADPNVSGGGVDPANQCGLFQTYDPPSGQCVYSLTSNTTLMAIAAGVALLLLIKR